MNLNRRFLAYRALFGVMGAAALAGCSQQQTRMREIDPQADTILWQMCEALDGAKAFSFRVRSSMDRPVETGQLAQFHRTSEVTVVRPGRLHLKTDSDYGKWTAWYRDKRLTILDREAGTYATETVPDRIDKMLDYMADQYDLVMPMADLLVGKTYDSLLASVEEGSYVGLHAVGDTTCHHLLFRQMNLDWQIWIDSGAQPLPRKLVITYTQEPDQPQYVATMDEWNLTPAVPDEAFTFTPPAGARSMSMSALVANE